MPFYSGILKFYKIHRKTTCWYHAENMLYGIARDLAHAYRKIDYSIYGKHLRDLFCRSPLNTMIFGGKISFVGARATP
jgi:hypothetical protein